MKTTFKKTHFHFLAAVGCALAYAPFAHAATQTPLDCPGVIAVKGGYRLTQDSNCGTGFSWAEDNKFFNLNGFTLTTDGISAGFTTGLTIRNGVLRTNSMNWEFSDKGTLSNLTVGSAGAPRGFFIEAGSNFTVKNSTFTNIPNIVLDFFFSAGGGTVRKSTFTGNGSAISIQRSNGVLIEKNKFMGNSLGVNLYDENGAGVSNNKIRYNTFRENGVGINLSALPNAEGLPVVDGNQIIGNNISRSSRSGILIEVTCEGFFTPPVCPGQNTRVSGNRLSRNGFDALADLPAGEEPDDDGVTARAVLRVAGGPDRTPFPEGLSGVTLSNNRADRNADLGFDVEGVTDGGGQVAKFNVNPEQCRGVACRPRTADQLQSLSIPSLTALQNAKVKAKWAPLQLKHKK
jgi:parallel beta-helix repeat protein